jgi:large subunit ribosomal protein L27
LGNISPFFIYPGLNTQKGSDDTIFATKTGVVKYQRWGKDRTKVIVLESVAK